MRKKSILVLPIHCTACAPVTKLLVNICCEHFTAKNLQNCPEVNPAPAEMWPPLGLDTEVLEQPSSAHWGLKRRMQL